MSIQAVAWVLEHSEATLADRLVLLSIANHADAAGRAWPAVPQIAREAGVGRSTVFGCIEALEELGELYVERRPGRASIYHVSALMGSRSWTGKGVQNLDGGVQNLDQRGPGSGPESSLTITKPRGAPAVIPRCTQCDLLKIDCECGKAIQKDKGKANVQAIRRRERTA